MKYHIRYWWARIVNDFMQLTLRRPNEKQIVAEVMGKLRRDPLLRQIIDDAEKKLKQDDSTAGSTK